MAVVSQCSHETKAPDAATTSHGQGTSPPADLEKTPRDHYTGSENSQPDRLDHVEHALPTRQLLLAYLAIFVMMFVHELASGIFRTLNPYVTSAFYRHSLTATTTVVSSVVSAVIKLPFAKLIGIWGRMQGLALMVASLLIGIILMASCRNVETYCAAQVFYTVGFYGIRFSIIVFISDTTAIRNRAFLIGFTGSPVIATLWAFGPATDRILATVGFRWGFGLWAPVYVAVCAPVFAVFYLTQKRLGSSLQGDSVPAGRDSVSSRTWLQTVVHYCKIFDLAGVLIIATALSFLLLAVSIYSYQADEWRSPLIICLLVFGGLLIPTFAFYERYLAPVTFIPWSLFTNKTVIASNIMVLTLQAAEMLSHAYFYSLLIVVFRQSITHATYITNIYYIGSTVSSLMLGIILRRFGRIKYFALCVGVPLVMLGVGLMIKFRTAESHIGYIILCQIFVAFGGGILYPLEHITLMAVSDHEHVPALLAVESAFAETGKGIGYALAGAIWTGMFKDRLVGYLPQAEQSQVDEIYGSINVQSSYPAGSPGFEAIAHAYGDTQRAILITSVGILVATLASTACWKDIDVKKMKQLRDRAL
ncbi:hypothetical protein FALCPG4_017215 [Fusarium falciforme]